MQSRIIQIEFKRCACGQLVQRSASNGKPATCFDCKAKRKRECTRRYKERIRGKPIEGIQALVNPDGSLSLPKRVHKIRKKLK